MATTSMDRLVRMMGIDTADSGETGREREHHYRMMQALMQQQREDMMRSVRVGMYDDYNPFRSDTMTSTKAPEPPKQPVMPPKPEATTPVFKPLDNDLSEYDAIAADLGFAPADLKKDRAERKHREVIGFMLDQGMPVYNTGTVKTFMDGVVAQKNYEAQVEKQKAGGRGQLGVDVPVLGWKWAKLSGYKHAIPIDILKRAKALKAEYPTAEFEVSDYEVVNPDPFISVTVDGCARVVFGVWDEPGFGAIGRDKGR